MERLLNSNVLNSTGLASETSSTAADLNHATSFCCIAVITDATPSAKAFATTDVDTTDDQITETAHGFVTGLKGQFTTTGTLPAGLSLATDYFVIRVDADTYAVGSSLANALAGTKVTITDVGSGTHTFTPTSLAGATAELQASVDGTNYATVTSSSQNITATANFYWNIPNPGFRYVKLVVNLTAGQLTVDADIQVVGEEE